jgi:ABC-2 type transport system permease protein
MTGVGSIAGTASAVFSRSARDGLRNPGPAMLLPALPPILLVVALTSLFDQLSDVIAFSAGSFEEHFVPGAIMIVAVAGGGFTSAQLAEDLRTGFADRLRLHTAHPRTLLLGRFAFEAVRVVPGAAAVLGVGLLFGGTLANGVPGALVIMALVMLLSVAYAGVFYVAAIITEDPQTPLNLNPLGIIVAFLSSAFIPRTAMPGWADRVADANPMTILVDGARAAMIGDLTSADVIIAVAVALAGVASSIALATAMLDRKMTRR